MSSPLPRKGSVIKKQPLKPSLFGFKKTSINGKKKGNQKHDARGRFA